MLLPQHEQVLVLDLQEAAVFPKGCRLPTVLLLQHNLLQVEGIEQRVQYLQPEGDNGAIPPNIPNEDAENTTRLEAPEYLQSDLPHLPDEPIRIADRRKIGGISACVPDDVQVRRMGTNQLHGVGGYVCYVPCVSPEQAQDPVANELGRCPVPLLPPRPAFESADLAPRERYGSGANVIADALPP